MDEITQVANDEQDDAIDLEKLTEIFRRCWKIWALVCVVLGGAVALLMLAFVPQNYSSTVSISIQQPGSGGGGAGALASLVGGGGASKKYIGLLKSRTLVKKAALKANLTRLYDCKSDYELEKLADSSIKVEDSLTDGLLYVTVQLEGPSKLSRDTAKRDAVRQASATMANSMAQGLITYYRYYDNDRDLVLLQAADKQLSSARNAYEAAIDHMGSFIRENMDTSRMDVSALAAVGSTSTAGGSSSTPATNTAPSEVTSLYQARGQLEIQKQSMLAGQNTRDRMITEQLNSINVLPSEDPLLVSARSQVREAAAELQKLMMQYGNDHPKVVVARESLQLARTRLEQQLKSVKKGLTTANVIGSMELSGVLAKQSALNELISAAEQKLHVSRSIQTKYEKIRNEITLRLEVLKTTASQAATLRIQTASAKNRVTVVDSAEPPFKAESSLMRIVGLALLVDILVVVIGLVREYHRMSTVQPDKAVQTAT